MKNNSLLTLVQNEIFSNSFNNLKIIQKKNKIDTNKLSKKVESIFINILIKSMRKSLSITDNFSNDQVKLYTEIYDEKISQILSSKGLGLDKLIKQQINFQK